MDALLKGIQSGKSTKELLKACCICISENRMDFLPGTNARNREVYEEEIAKGLHEILKLANEFYEYVFIDITHKNLLPFALKAAVMVLPTDLNKTEFVIKYFFFDIKYHS